MNKITKYGIAENEVVSITTEHNNWRSLIENVLVGRMIGDLNQTIHGLTAQNIGLMYDRMAGGMFNDSKHQLEINEHRVIFKNMRDKINKMDNDQQQKALKEFVTGRKETQAGAQKGQHYDCLF